MADRRQTSPEPATSRVLVFPNPAWLQPSFWTQAPLPTRRLENLVSRVFLSLAVSPNGKLLAVGGGMYEQSGEVKIFDLATGAERASFPDHKEWVECVTFSADGHWLASGGGFSRELPGEIRVWDAKRLVAKGE